MFTMKLESRQLKALIQEGVREKLEELTGKDPQKLQEFLDWLFKKQSVSDLERKAGLVPDAGSNEVGDVGSNEFAKLGSNKAYLKAGKEAADLALKFQRALTKLADTVEASIEADPTTASASRKELIQLNRYRKSVIEGAKNAKLVGPGTFFTEGGGKDTHVQSMRRVAGTVDFGDGPKAYSSELDDQDSRKKRPKMSKFTDEKGVEKDWESLLENMSKELSRLVK
jgi:hypothetical protein